MEVAQARYGSNFPSALWVLKCIFEDYVSFPEELFDGMEWLRRNGYHTDIETDPRFFERLRDFKKFLYDREEDEIIVITHLVVIRKLVSLEGFKGVRNAEGITVTWKEKEGEQVLVPIDYRGGKIRELNALEAAEGYGANVRNKVKEVKEKRVENKTEKDHSANQSEEETDEVTALLMHLGIKDSI